MLCAVLISASVMSLVGCGNETESEPAETTAPIYVQADEIPSASESENPATAENLAPADDTISDAPEVISDKTNSSFENLDEVYNTNLAPNIPDSVTFSVTLTYTTDFNTENPSSSISEIIKFSEGTTYADICNLDNLNVVPADGEDLAYSVDKLASKEKSIYEKFEYYGIPHTVYGAITEWTDEYNDVHKVKPTITLELVSNGEIVTDAASLVSNDNSILVKAISAKTVTYNSELRIQKKNTPVFLTYTVTTADGISEEYEVGMRWDSIKSKLENQNLRDGSADRFYFGDKDAYFVLKNAYYSLVLVKEGSYIGNISLIKN